MLLFSYPYPSSLPTRHKKYKEYKYRPTDAAAANNGESRDAIVMATMPNVTAALQQDTESPTSPVATTGPSTATGATTTTASSIATEATATPGPGATGVTTRPVIGSFDLSEDQINLSRGLF